MNLNLTGPQFEDEVRNISRNLFSNHLGQGSTVVDGRERDGVFWNGQFYTVVECTTMRTKEKAETDGKKTHELVSKIRQQGHMAQGYFVTLHEPTPDQKDAFKAKKYDRTTRIISFDELRSLLFDSLTYINNREKKRFGSVYDHVEDNYDIPLSDFVEPTVVDPLGANQVSYRQLLDSLQTGSRCVLVAEYGVGKSMMLRHLFHGLVQRFRSKKNFRTPIAINLRDHLGQTDPIELLERHARANAINPSSLVAAWNAGYVDLLLDGFDELTTRGWTGDVRRLKEYRRLSHSVVRKLVKETPSNASVVIAGRDAYFDSTGEMREALGASEESFRILRVFPFDEKQSHEFLYKKGFKGDLPDWMPTRPLLLTYLAGKGLLQSVINADSSGDFPRGAAWLSLVDMIARRESEQLEGVDKEQFLLFFGALGVRARQTPGGQTSFSPQVMEELFSKVTGSTILEDERNLLLRLPGLGVAQDSPLHRSFIDRDFMNVVCALPSLKYVYDPYSDYSDSYSFDALVDPMNEVGCEALSTLFYRSSVQTGVAVNAVRRACEDGHHQLAHDIFFAAQGVNRIPDRLEFDGIAADEVDLVSDYLDGSTVRYSNCIIDRVLLPQPEDTNYSVTFSDCLIGRVEGRVALGDLNEQQFIDCEVDEFTDEYNVNSEILDSSLPMGIKVLIVSLRKLFTQGGGARLESALFRGLDQRS